MKCQFIYSVKLNKITIFILIIFIALSNKGNSKEKINTYLDTPLFDFSVEKNDLPQGNFRLLRSYAGVTQILESINDYDIILHIDRENNKPGKIYSKAYSRFHNVFLETEEITQNEFDTRVEHLIRNGDLRKSSTHLYPGLKTFINYAINQRSQFTKEGIIYKIRMEEGPLQSKLKINVFNKNLFISNIMSNERIKNFILFPVYIKDTKDRNILKIIRKYVAKFYDIRNN